MKTWAQKILLFLGPFSTGIILGRIITTPKVKQQETHSEAHSTLKVQSVIQSNDSTTQDATRRGSETIVKKVYYCPTGGIKSEVQIERKFGAESLKSSASTNIQQDIRASQASSTQASSTVSQYQSNWSVGIFLPPGYPLKSFDPAELSGQIGYRVVGPFSISFQSDTMFKRPQVGVVVNF